MVLTACSQSPAPVASKPKSPVQTFRSADAPEPFIHPVPTGRISSSFANYIVKSRNRKHHGIDFAAPIGTPVYAASSGVVLNADMGSMSDAFGLAVLIEHGDKFQSLSAHLSRIDVNIGDWVQAGQQIGLVGKTGRATGPHLHFELWQNTIPKDPLLFLPIKAPNRAIAAEPKVSSAAPSLLAKQQESANPSAKMQGAKSSVKPQANRQTKRQTKNTKNTTKAKKITTKTAKQTSVKTKKAVRTNKKTVVTKQSTKTSKSSTTAKSAKAKSVTTVKSQSNAKVNKVPPREGTSLPVKAKTPQVETGSSKP